MNEQQLKHPTLDLAVVFFWKDDRFAHAIRGGTVKALQCSEANASSQWPDCPPIQQLSVETIADRDVALGVGSAGTSHWSVSVEPIDAGFRFDWACKCKQAPEQLGIAYHPSEPASDATLQALPNDDTQVDAASGLFKLGPKALADTAGTFRWCYDVVPTAADGKASV